MRESVVELAALKCFQSLKYRLRTGTDIDNCDEHLGVASTILDAWQAFSQHSPDGARIWLERLSRIEPAAVEDVFHGIPPQRMSQVSREFTLRLLDENKQRLLS